MQYYKIEVSWREDAICIFAKCWEYKVNTNEAGEVYIQYLYVL